MKFSEQWLREWADPPVGTEQLAEQLTLAGLEVDTLLPVAPEFAGVVVGEVLSVEPHPQADRLRVCRVNTGQVQPLTIVCGARNVHAGMRAPTACIGARLPNGIDIRKTCLRGVDSEGMLCSAMELGLTENATGLMELPPDAKPGTDIRTLLHLDDRAIELELTPNRGDCLSIAGIAREAGVLNRCRINVPDMDAVHPAIGDSFDITIEAPDCCPRYLGRVIKGINASVATPLWMSERLRRSGIRLISPVVDVTNYVMLELGQPMHAFDLDVLVGGIRVRHARAGETIRLLDGQEITMTDDTLVIADHHRAVALAGIMGGVESAVTSETGTLFLESAFFTPEVIAGRARAHGLHTDSSHRFERGVDPALPRRAMERATALLLDIVGGQAGPVVECVDETQLPRHEPIRLRAGRIQRLLGVTIHGAEVEDILSRLRMRISAEGEEGWRVTAPSYRFDIACESDLVEEIARIHGYHQLPARPPVAQLSIRKQPGASRRHERIRRLLVDRGYQEVITYSFVDVRLQTLLDPGYDPVPLTNPISTDMGVMRTNLWPGLVQALIYNQNHQQKRIRLFEVGRKFSRHRAAFREENVVAGIATGDAYPEQWGVPRRAVDFFDVKADLESLLADDEKKRSFSFTAQSHPALHPGHSACIRNGSGETAGWIGALHPAIAKELGIAGEVLVFEVKTKVLKDIRLPVFQEFSKFPSIRRDLAISVDAAVPAQVVCECIRQAAGPLLQELHLFDVYQGKGVEEGRKSIALGLTLQDFSRTLTDDETDTLITRVLSELHNQLGAALRD